MVTTKSVLLALDEGLLPDVAMIFAMKSMLTMFEVRFFTALLLALSRIQLSISLSYSLFWMRKQYKDMARGQAFARLAVAICNKFNDSFHHCRVLTFLG